MLFNSFSYLLFLPLVFSLYWLLPVRFRRPLLLIASYLFYMSWKPAYGLLIFFLTLINYGLGLVIDKVIDKKKSRFVLTAGLIFNLGALCYFKYTDFLLEAIFAALATCVKYAHLTLPQSCSQPVLDIVLPLGISFFTFEFIHYLVDVYKGGKAVKNFVDFALFASFFPSQIAGPIKRYQDFINQIAQAPVFNSVYFQRGIFLILQGLFKKVVLGDNLSPLVNYGFTNCAGLSTVDAWITVIAFSYQLYFDFSGYTDIGIGSALLFGYKVPENFNLPFLAASLTDFWRRWHISLSSWLRDYLFIPMGGSRGSELKTRRNLVLTMVLGGLWHGAAWHFVVWGMLHGLGLVVCKEWSRLVSASSTLVRLRQTRHWHLAGIALTNLFVYLAFAVFRAENMGQARTVISQFFGLTTPEAAKTAVLAGLSQGEVISQALASPLLTALPLYAAFCLVRAGIDRKQTQGSLPAHFDVISNFWQSNPAVRGLAYVTVFLAIIAFAPGQGCPFIYFQF